MALRRVLLTITSGGAISNLLFVKPALKLATRIQIAVAHVKPALAVSMLTALRVPVRPAAAITQRASGTLRAVLLPALLVRPRAALVTPTKEALALVQIKYDLVQTKGANAQAGTGTAWTNPGNSTGRKDAANATITGNATFARDGTLTLSYADTVSKTALTIQSVTLKFYVSHTTTLAAASLTLAWAKGGAFTTLQTLTETQDALAAGLSFDITSSITSWADLDALQTSVRFVSSVGAATSNAALDAVECVVTGTLTDAI